MSGTNFVAQRCFPAEVRVGLFHEDTHLWIDVWTILRSCSQQQRGCIERYNNIVLAFQGYSYSNSFMTQFYKTVNLICYHVLDIFKSTYLQKYISTSSCFSCFRNNHYLDVFCYLFKKNIYFIIHENNYLSLVMFPFLLTHLIFLLYIWL